MAEAATDKGGGQLSKKGARTRERIVDAAKQVFERDGFLDARISDIAEAAELSHGSFYYYFDSKEEIFREVAALVDAELSAPLSDVILADSHVSPQDRLREAIRRHLEAYKTEAGIMGVVEQVSRYDDQVAEARRVRNRENSRQVAASIRALQERGMADPELDPTIVARVIGGLTDRFAEMWFVQKEIRCSFDDGVDQVARMIINILGLDGDRRPTRGD